MKLRTHGASVNCLALKIFMMLQFPGLRRILCEDCELSRVDVNINTGTLGP